MAEPFIAEVRIFGFNFAPRGWAFCDGQLLPISQNTALFSLVGTTYGGDGRTTFALPDLRGRCAIGSRQGPGLSDRRLGEQLGQAQVPLNVAQLPSHSHGLMAAASADSNDPTGRAMATTATGDRAYRAQGTPGPTTSMANAALESTGGSAAHENRQPYLGVKFCIAMVGLYPSRS